MAASPRPHPSTLTSWPMRLVTLVSLALAVSAVQWPVAAGIDLDGNYRLNVGLPKSIFHFQGQYSPRWLVPSTIRPVHSPPAGCVIDQVSSLERHGARYPTSSATKKIQATLTAIQKALANVDVNDIAEPKLRFLKTVQLQLGQNDLVPYGALQAFYSGQSTASIYPGLLSKGVFVRSTGDVDGLNDRVIVTAQYWKLGFSGANFPRGSIATSNQTRFAPGLPAVDLVMSELAGVNNTLDVSTCTANENQSPKPETAAQAAYGASTLEPVIGARLSQGLAPANITFTYTDILNLMSLCSFDTLGRATVENGKLRLPNNSTSDFCAAFNEDEWQLYGYANDVGKWAGGGYGSKYARALGQGYLRELLARWTGTPPVLDPVTSLNTTLDAADAPSTFPLDKGIYFDGTHDNNLAPIATALGLFNGPSLDPSKTHAEQEPRNWFFSRIAPFQGKLVFERLQCGGDEAGNGAKAFIRIRANGAIQPARGAYGWCADADRTYSRYGLCALESVVKSLAWVQTDAEWSKCYL